MPRFSDRFSAYVALFLAPGSTLLVLFLWGFLMNSPHRVEIPDTALEFTQRGLSHVNAGNTATAIADFNQALALQPDYIPATQGIAMSYWKQGNKTEALSLFNQAIESYKAQGEPIAASYLKAEVRALKRGDNLPCLHYVDNQRLRCSPV
jgi:tetratricopeptide (TPR) repeat protein